MKNVSESIPKNKDSLKTTWIKVADTLSNFEALVASGHLYYIEHMSVDYDNFGKDFWKSIDTTINNDRIFIKTRVGACQKVGDTLFTELCIERQQHTVNKRIGKVIKFVGNGSGYAANIEYLYDASGKLRQYKNSNTVFYLKYDAANQLEEVLKTNIINGIQIEIERIQFRKISLNKK
ncbi:MAG: hypothetical protein AB8B65_12055 [Kordia sp.]|uniref:hypothetical protein n=1 Tax=Kordia sp. TaxID=1965332 RepID=UPI00385C2CED